MKHKKTPCGPRIVCSSKPYLAPLYVSSSVRTMPTAIKFMAFLLASALAASRKLATFDEAEGTTVVWRVFNDLVMGGASTSTFKTTANKTGLFNGTCAIVNFLKAPGFAKIQGSGKFADMTGYDNIALRYNLYI